MEAATLADFQMPEVNILRLQPGDKIMLTLPAHAPGKLIEDVRKTALEKFAPHEVIVKTREVDFAVIRDT